MPHTPFSIEILTPEGAAFSGEVQMLSTRTAVGSLGVLANHQPLLAMLEPTELRLYRSDNDIVRYAQGDGYLQVNPDETLLLVDELIPADQLNVSELNDRIKR